MNVMNSASEIHFHRDFYIKYVHSTFLIYSGITPCPVVTFIPSRLVNYIAYAYFSLSKNCPYI